MVVVPTYNERENLPQIVPAILAQDARVEILVVDDGSPDGTGELANGFAAQDPRVHVLHRASKQGLGRAYLAGFAWARIEREYAWVFEMDADFSARSEEPDPLIQATADADLIVGSRYASGVNVINWPMSRLLLSWFANKYARWVTGLQLTDGPEGSSASGARCWRRSRSTGCARTATPSRSR